MALPDECPKCGARLVPISQPNQDRLERVECMGDEKHVYPVLGDTPRDYRLGPEPSDKEGA